MVDAKMHVLFHGAGDALKALLWCGSYCHANLIQDCGQELMSILKTQDQGVWLPAGMTRDNELSEISQLTCWRFPMNAGAFILTASLNESRSFTLAFWSVEVWLFLNFNSSFSILAPGTFLQSFSNELRSFIKSVKLRRLWRLEFM